MSSVKRRGLGRGLDALLGGASPSLASTADAADAEGELAEIEAERGAENAAQPESMTPAGGLNQIGIDLIKRGRFQPRRNFDEERLRELADSITAQGVLQPIVVRPVDDHYEIIAGERRWRAAQLAGLGEMPVVVREVDDQAAMAMALIENIQRDDLNPLEEAEALQRLLNEFALTHQQIAQAVGKSRTTVSNLLRLIELEADVKQMVEQGKLEMGHARAILGLKGAQQSEAAAKVVRAGLSVRETEKLVRRLQGLDAKPAPAPVKSVDPNIQSLEQQLCEKLGAIVRLQSGVKGKGKLVISYNSLEELDGILEHIN
ncbi:MAG: ParB/RepB/Spo0J family partition protein [Pseudomonadota bacterium]